MILKTLLQTGSKTPAQRCLLASGRDASGCGDCFSGSPLEAQVSQRLGPGVESYFFNCCLTLEGPLKVLDLSTGDFRRRGKTLPS